MPAPHAAPHVRIFFLLTDCRRFPPAGMHSRLRACVMRYLGLRIVVEGKQEPDTTYAYVGVGLAGVEQLLLASVREDRGVQFPTSIW